MMPELGETADPRALVPGDVNAVHDAARALTGYAGNLAEAGDGLASITSARGWRGSAADAFCERFAPQPGRWHDAGDAFTAAARALAVHAETLGWAQRQAGDAVALWQEAAAATGQARQLHDEQARLPAPPGTAPLAPFTDPGEPQRRRAQEILDHARTELAEGGNRAADVVTGACDAAPRTFWGDVGVAAQDALDVGKEAVDGLASIGNAALHHPDDLGMIAGGTGLMALGVAGELGGAALDTTIIGALGGVPLNAVSVGAMAGGATMAGAGALSMAQSAAGDDEVSPLEIGGGSGPSGPSPAPAAERPAVENPELDNIVGPLYRATRSEDRTGDGTTADAVRHERATGDSVKDRFHTRKASNTVRALRRSLRKNPDASPEDRGIAQQEYDNLLDALGRTQ